MEVVYERINRILLKNDNGELSLGHIYDFEDNRDEILIRTQVDELNLKRGWIGDLTYDTTPGLGVEDEEIWSFGARDTFRDVLLASVKVWSTDNGIITWEYRFLKK